MSVEWMSVAWKVVVAAAILGISAVLGSWLAGMADRVLDRSGLDPMVRRLLAKAVRPLVLVVGFVAAVQYLQVDLTPITAMLGASTLAVGMALQGSLSNVASGALLLTLRPYREGDFVSLGGKAGTVVEQSYFRVLLRGVDGVLVSLPNNSVFNGPIENFTLLGQRRVGIDITLDLAADTGKAIEVLTEVLAAHEAILEEPGPQVLITALTPRGPTVTVRGWVTGAVLFDVQSELIQASLAALAKAKVAVAPAPVAAL